MENKTSFFHKFFTSIYEMKAFSKYAKEGLVRAIIYAALMVLILGSIKSGIDIYDLNKRILNISSQLEDDNYNINIENGILKIDKPYIFEDGSLLIYADDTMNMINKDQVRNLSIHKDIYALFLEDGIIINNSINEYNINYSSIFKNNLPIDTQINIIRLVIISIVFTLSLIIRFFDFLINCLIVAIAAGIIALFMKMVVKRKALYSLTIYAATLPFLIQIILEIISPHINFDMIFMAGTLTYLILILKYIKSEIIENIKQSRFRN